LTLASSRLISPSIDSEATVASFITEMRECDEALVPWILEECADDFAAFLAYLEEQSNGIGLSPGFVPSSTYWLVDDNAEVVAVSNLRHALTDSLRVVGGHIGFGVRPSVRRRGYATEALRQTLLQAYKLEINDVLVTCDKGNIGSEQAIIRNGGVFDSEEYLESHGAIVQRYWICRHPES
jgi:predicted acetyltransferase